MWQHLWAPLARKADALGHADMFYELLLELNNCLVMERSAQVLALAGGDPGEARRQFRQIRAAELKSELATVGFLEACFETLEELGGDVLANHYYSLLDRFLVRFGSRYDLRRPCRLCPTLQGMFSSLVDELKKASSRDSHLDSLMIDYERAIRNLRDDASPGQIKTCIQKQVNLLEAIGAACPGVTETELGSICNQLATWPHSSVKASIRNLYGFASNYPGIRHAGNPASALRDIEMRDLVAMSILLAGFTPYLSDQLDADVVYRGR
jgi:hypothetical protein